MKRHALCGNMKIASLMPLCTNRHLQQHRSLTCFHCGMLLYIIEADDVAPEKKTWRRMHQSGKAPMDEEDPLDEKNQQRS